MEEYEEAKLNAAGFASVRRSSGRHASKPPPPPPRALPSKRRKVGSGDDGDDVDCNGGEEEEDEQPQQRRTRGRPPRAAAAGAAAAAAAAAALAASPAEKKAAAKKQTKRTKRKRKTKRYGGMTTSSSEGEEESEASSDDDDFDSLIAPAAAGRAAASDDDDEDDEDYDDERKDPTVAGIFSGELESEDDSEDEDEGYFRGRGRGGGRGPSWTVGGPARRTPSPDGEDAPFPDYAPPETTERRKGKGGRGSSAGGAADAANETDNNKLAFAPDPAALRVRPFSRLPRAAGELPPALIPADALADAVASYLILRAFSWQLRLSPFSLADWCAALAARSRPTQLLDEAAVCLLRALAWDETVQERRRARRRRLPIGLLDSVTWPEFSCDALRKAGHFKLAKIVEGGDGVGGGGGGLAVVEEVEGGEEEEEAAPAAAAAAAAAAPAAVVDAPPPAAAAAPAAAANGDQPMAEDDPAPDAAADAAPAAGDAATGEDAAAIAAALLRRSTRERAPPPPPLYQPTLPGRAAAASASAAAPAGPSAASAPRAPACAAAIAAAAATAASLLPRRRSARLSSHPLHATLSAGPQLACRSPIRQRPEFFSLPASTKAAVLSALADALLETRAVRSELNLRESEGWFVSGARGGVGGSGQMWSSVSERDEAVARGEGNYDVCVLCGYGGSLLCCDACPGAYHFRCVGIQPSKLKDDEDWICPECEIGGRAESAGLRVPCVGVDRETGCAAWVAHSALLRGARPPRAGTGADAVEGSSEGLPLEALVGEEAKAAWRASEAALIAGGGAAAAAAAADGEEEENVEVRKIPSCFATTAIVRQRGSERPHESTLELIARGEQQPTLHDASTTGAAETFKNRYANGWASAVTVYKAAYEECARRRGRPTAGLPMDLTFSEQAEPMPLAKFSWPASQGKGLVLPWAAKCGRCETCTNPNQRKACLAPVFFDGAGAGGGAGAAGALVDSNGNTNDVAFPAPPPPPHLNVKLQALINFTLKLERDVSPLLEGPWGGGGDGSDGGGGGSGGGGGASDDDFGRAEFRRAWAARLREASDVRTVAAALLQIEAAARRVVRTGPWRPPPPIRIIPGKPFAEPPRIARTPGGWMMDASGRRRDSAPGRLPPSHVRRAARRGTNLRISQIDYYTSPIVTPPHLAWRRDVGAARSTAALAVQARVLSDALHLQYLRRPDVLKKGPSTSAAAAVADAVSGDIADANKRAVKAAAAAAAARRKSAAARKKAAAGGGGGAGSDDDDGDGGGINFNNALGSCNLADVWSRTKLKERRPGPRDRFLGPTFEYLVELPDDAPAEGCAGAGAAAAAAAAGGAGGIKVKGGNFVVGSQAATGTGGGLYGAVAAACADGSLQIDCATAPLAAAPAAAASAPPHVAGAGTLLPAPLSAPPALAVAANAPSNNVPSATVAALARYRATLAAAAADDGSDERGVHVSVKLADLGRSGKAGVSAELEVLTAKARAAQQAYDLARAEVLRASGIREEVVRAAALGKDPVALAKHLAALTVHGYTPAGGVGSGFLRAGSAGGGDGGRAASGGGGGGGATTDTNDDDDDDGGDEEGGEDEEGDGNDTDDRRDGSRQPPSSSHPPSSRPAAAAPPLPGRVSTKPYRTAEECRRLAASASTASRRRRLAAEEVLAALSAAQLPPPPTGIRMRGRVKQAARWAALPMRELSSRATRTRAPGLAPEAAAIAARGMLNPNSSRAIEGIAAAAAAARAEDRQALRKKRVAAAASAAARAAAGRSRSLAAAVAARQQQKRGPGRPRLGESEKRRRELQRLAGAGGGSAGISLERSPTPGGGDGGGGGSDVQIVDGRGTGEGEDGGGDGGGDDGDDDNDDEDVKLAKTTAAAKAAAADFLAREKEIEAAEEQLYDPKTQLPYLPATKLSWVHEDRLPIWLMREFEEEARGGPLKGTWKPAPSLSSMRRKKKKGKRGGGKMRTGAFGETSSEDDEEYSDDEEDEDDGLCGFCRQGERAPGEDDDYLTKKKKGGGQGGEGGGGGDGGTTAAVTTADDQEQQQQQDPDEDDEPEPVTAWIGCEGECGKWYHPSCVKLTPEQYKALNAAADNAGDDGDGENDANLWVCPTCVNKQAAKEARKLAKLAALSSLAPMSEIDRQLAAREAAAAKAAAEAAGRAAKEMGKQAKLAMRQQRAAEKALEKEERTGAKAAAAAERQARKEAERAAKREEKRRRLSSAGSGSASKRSKKAAVELLCVCRGPEADDDPRGFVQCEGGCSQWFHPVCVGESMAEIEARGEGFKWSCPGCLGRGEVLAAMKKKSADAAAAAGNPSSSSSFHSFLPPLTPQAALAAKAVVDAVASSPPGRPFSEPVPLDVPNYKEMISRPMDLGTISARLALSAGAAPRSSSSDLRPYSTLSEALEDVALVWSNCATFNLEGSQISRQAAAAAEDLRRRWWLAAATADTSGAVGVLRWHCLEGSVVSLPATQVPSDGDYPAAEEEEGEEKEEEEEGEGAGGGGWAGAMAMPTAEATAAAAAAPLAPPPPPPSAAPPAVPIEFQQQLQPALVAPAPMEFQQQQLVAAAPSFAPPPPVAAPVAAPPTAMPVDDDDEQVPFGDADATAAAPVPPPDFLG